MMVFLITTKKWEYFWLAAGVPSGFSVQFCSIDTYVINDQNEGGEHTTHKFAADNRLGGAVDSSAEQDALQRDIDTLEH